MEVRDAFLEETMAKPGQQIAKEPEFEIIPVSLGANSMLDKMFQWRNWILQLAIEHAAHADGISLKEGWTLDARNGVWRRPKKPEAVDGTQRSQDTATRSDR